MNIQDSEHEIKKWVVNPIDLELGIKSNKKIDIKCPLCGNIRKQIIVANITKRKDINCTNSECQLNKRKTNNNYSFNIGDRVNGLIVLQRTVKTFGKNNQKVKSYLMKCDNDEYEFISTEYQLKNGLKCPLCQNQIIIKGINDIASKRPDMINYFVYKEDVYKYSPYSNKKTKIRCCSCGCEKEMVISNLFIQGFSCPKCGDGISFPEKFLYCVLNRLNCDVIYQLSKTNFTWCENYKYDFYIPKFSLIIETHGIQHYKESNRGRSLIKEQENDSIKELLAKENGIEHYIVLDCRKSELEWIKKSIEDSELSKIFSLSKIDWNECIKESSSSLVKRVSDLYNINMPIKDISEKLGICRETTRKYLKRGSSCGFCDYKV